MSDNENDIPGATDENSPALGQDIELKDVETPADAAAQDIPLEEMQAPEKSVPQPVTEKTAADLEPVFDVPVRVSVILGRTKIPVAELLKMDVGTVVELDRQVGEAIEIYVNDRLIARGEIVLVENKLGVTMTEIIKAA